MLGLIVGVTVPILGRYNHKLYSISIGISLGIVIAVLAGWAFSALYIKMGKYNETFLKIVFWSNTVVWIVPMLGYFVAAVTSEINRRNQGSDKRKYFLLAGFGSALSLLHIILRIANVVRW